MRIPLLAALVFAAAPAQASDPSTWRIVGIHDGDTFEVLIPDLPAPLQRVGIRVRGVDAPEMPPLAKCDLEAALAVDARDYAMSFLRGKPLRLEDLRWDKYGGRIDATVLVGDRNLATELIAAGLGHAFNGQGKRTPWCKKIP